MLVNINKRLRYLTSDQCCGWRMGQEQAELSNTHWRHERGSEPAKTQRMPTLRYQNQ